MTTAEIIMTAPIEQVRKANAKLVKRFIITTAVTMTATVATIVLADMIDKRLDNADEE